MKQNIELWIALWIALCTLATTSPSEAQIVPDATLPVNSNVTPDGNTNIISGGTAAGGNLFHSFEQFSVPTGSAAFFNNAPDIQNIISRVTGRSVSNIDGLIRANGNANLFLLNPNGIVFGPNSSLNIGGSFLGSTASAVNFADGTNFSATVHSTTPLLSVSVPLSLQYGGTTPGSILNQSRATNSSGQVVGLQVPSGKTLALVGGDVRLDGGILQASGGRVELAGVAGSQTVGLNVDGNNLRLTFPVGVRLADVSLDNSASVNVPASGGGSIAINAQNLNLAGRSRLQAGINPGLGSMDSVAGDVEINVTGTININNGSSISNVVNKDAVGNGGDINITAESLALRDGALLSASTSGRGNAGSVTINARDISFDGESSNGSRSGAFSSVADTGVGDGGSINITTGSLALRNGALLSARTFGQGNGGSVTINAHDSVSFDGESSDGSRSGAFSGVGNKDAVGNAGGINITTGSLALRNGARLSTRTSGRGNAGDVTIIARDTISFDGESNDGSASDAVSIVDPEVVGNGGSINITTGSLALRNGAVLTATTRGRGNAGDVTIIARDTISFDGESNDGAHSGAFSSVDAKAVGDGGGINITTGSLALTNGGQLSVRTFGQGNAGNVTIIARDTVSFDGRSSDGKYPSGAFSGVGSRSVGNAGGINITTSGQLIVRDGAQLNVSSQGSGNPGNLFVEAGSLLLDNQGKLLASTASGEGGNINLQVQDLILMRRNSLISAEARGSGNGGSITIKAPLIVAVPSENSDIVANAFLGRGGNINITSQGIYGLENRDELTSESDINASSQFGVNGVVQINTLDIDPSHAIIALPVELVDASGLIVSGCGAGGRQGQSEFIVTGRGGLPPNPSESLSSDTVWTDLRAIAKIVENVPISEEAIQQTLPTAGQLVEAQGWVINSKGEVVLTASAPNVTPHSPGLTQAECYTP